MKRRMSSHLLVVAQLGCVALCCYPQGWRNAGSRWWLLLCLVGSLLGVISLYFNRPGNFSIYPEMRHGARLITNGPYKLVRHPMYTALFFMMVGAGAYNGHWINLLSAIVLVAILHIKAVREENLLPDVFDEYPPYAASTKRFIPWIY